MSLTGNYLCKFFRVGALGLVLIIQSGCYSLSALSSMRELPASTSVSDIAQVDFDASVDGYRFKSTGSEPGDVVRDASGRKIRWQDQLQRWSEASTQAHKHLWTPGMKVSGIALAVIYVPVGIVVGIAEGIAAIPVEIYTMVAVGRMTRESESMYRAGRKELDAAHYPEALAALDRAMIASPLLRTHSDVEYWRGRAFEAIGEKHSARTAYLDFLDYSERSLPDFFEGPAFSDPTWAEKAKDAESRAATLS